MSNFCAEKISPSGKFRYEIQNSDNVRETDGRLQSTNLQKIYRVDGKSEVLVTILEHRDISHWFMQNSIQYLLCPYRHDAVVGKSQDWTTNWFRKTIIVNCETGKQIFAPIYSRGRGFFGFELSDDANFLLLHTYDGYDNSISICNVSNLEQNDVKLININATSRLPEHNYHVFDIGCDRVVYLTQYWFEEQNKELRPSSVMYVPEVYHCQWIYDEQGLVSRFKITTTCEYVIRGGFAFTHATNYNILRAKNTQFDLEDATDELKVEWATATFELDKEKSVFKQTGFVKFPYVDMPETKFNRLFERKTTDGKVDAWGR